MAVHVYVQVISLRTLIGIIRHTLPQMMCKIRFETEGRVNSFETRMTRGLMPKKEKYFFKVWRQQILYLQCLTIPFSQITNSRELEIWHIRIFKHYFGENQL